MVIAEEYYRNLSYVTSDMWYRFGLQNQNCVVLKDSLGVLLWDRSISMPERKKKKEVLEL